jgi:hypothetical protein
MNRSLLLLLVLGAESCDRPPAPGFEVAVSCYVNRPDRY